jgi:two-component system cell cycle response regulator
VAQNDALEETLSKLEESNSSLYLASRRFQELFNGLPVACFTFDENGFIHEWNRGAELEFDFTPGTACLQPIWKVFRDQTGSPWTQARVKSIFELEHQPSFDWKFSREGREDAFFACNIIALRDKQGRPVGAVCTNMDITSRVHAERRIEEQIEQINLYAGELREVNHKLNHLAVTDGLTGLWNHRRFKQMLDDAFESHVRAQQPFSLIMLDIDHFKQFNDEFGHQTGDEVLKLLAQRLRDCARTHEQPSRYGGEEFAVLLQNCDEAAAKRAAARIQRSLKDICVCGRTVTASFGISTWKEGQSTNSLITQADKALYYSKQHGRNRSTHYNDVAEQIQNAA